jgi:hypothetical protein
MKFAIAIAALAAGVSASYPGYSAAPNVTYTTQVVTSYETYCPGPTQITYGTNTYTVTEVWNYNGKGKLGRSDSHERWFQGSTKVVDKTKRPQLFFPIILSRQQTNLIIRPPP